MSDLRPRGIWGCDIHSLALRHRLTVRVLAVACSDDWDWPRRGHPRYYASDPDLNPELQHYLGQVLVRGELPKSRRGSRDLDSFMRKEDEVLKYCLACLAKARWRSRRSGLYEARSRSAYTVNEPLYLRPVLPTASPFCHLQNSEPLQSSRTHRRWTL